MKLSFLDKIVFRAPLNSYDKKDAVGLDAMEEALYLASPVLLAEARKDKGNSKRSKKLQDSIYKYHRRSCTRCTPFGLFAGVGTGEWGNHSSVILSGRQRRTRLDMNYLCALGQYIASLEEVKEKLLFFPNNSIYVAGDKLRYVEYQYVQTQRLYSLSEVQHSEYLDKVLRIAQDGAYAEDLATAIADAEITIEEAREFISELIDNQLLKSELEPNVTGTYYFDKILQKVNLQQINESLQKLDSNLSNTIDDYKNIISLLKELPVPFEENQLFQTDLYWNTSSATLDRKIQHELLKALNFLSRIHPQGETPLKKFAKEFYERYEHAEVPLLQALDTESGIGYAHNKGKDNNPLLDGIITAQRSPAKHNFHEKLRGNQYIVAFTDDDLPEAQPVALPATMAVGFTLPGDNQIMLGYAAGPCAANILGRFCHAGNEILKITEQVIAHENEFYKDKIVAEIVHLPEARTGNILSRPAFREYEIPYLSNASAEKTIALSDLYISIGAGDRIILRSKKLNKEVIPRLTNAHNFSFNSQPVYHFLCDLQSQGASPGIAFDWGAEYKFTPRAVYGNVILKPATWKLTKEDVQELTSANAIPQFLAKWQMPPTVLLTEEDNTLLVDWHDEASFHSFTAAIKQKEKFTLTEHLFKSSVIKDSEGRCHVNEFLAFLINNDFPAPDRQPVKFKQEQRSFPPGSEWLYYKIYTGPKTADEILRTYIKPFIEQQDLIHKWFFIRYADPHHHLRVRFHLRCDAGKIINAFHPPGWKIQIDTYEREIERYGLFGMENCETYFCHNSEYILSVLSNIHTEEERWLAGFKAVDELLNSFGFQLQEKENLINQLAQSFIQEFGGGKILKLSLSNKYRQLRKLIETNLTETISNTTPVIQNLQHIRDRNGLFTEYDDLVCSFIHMMLNRLFRSQQRMHELVIYDLLSQYYRSVLARSAIAQV